MHKFWKKKQILNKTDAQGGLPALGLFGWKGREGHGPRKKTPFGCENVIFPILKNNLLPEHFFGKAADHPEPEPVSGATTFSGGWKT